MKARQFASFTAATAVCLGLCLSWSTSASAVDISACPFAITAGGTYRVVNDLTAIGTCITITPPASASSITIKLNGFTITGPGTGTAGASGIIAPVPTSKINVDGPGAIVKFGAGIALPFTEGATVERVNVLDNGLGIVVSQGSVSDSVVSGNQGNGVTVGDDSIVSNVTANDNGETGIEVGTESTVSQSTANSNGAGVSAGVRSLVRNTTANDNSDFGITIGIRGTVEQSTANHNGESGIIAEPGSNIKDNTASNNSIGILAHCPATIQQNTAQFNFVGLGLEDIVLSGDGCTLKNNITTGL